MSIQERKEEAEAVLDSAEMILETYGSRGDAARKLEKKVSELHSELENPESEKSLRELVEEIQELMEDIQEEPVDEPVMGPGNEMGGMGPGNPEDDVPPF